MSLNWQEPYRNTSRIGRYLDKKKTQMASWLGGKTKEDRKTSSDVKKEAHSKEWWKYVGEGRKQTPLSTLRPKGLFANIYNINNDDNNNNLNNNIKYLHWKHVLGRYCQKSN